jgi:hypothetical protein
MNAIITFDNKINFMGMEIINIPDLITLILRFFLNLGVIMILVRLLYYSVTRRKDYLMTYLLISSVVFLLCFLLESVKLEIGFALGLFAVFGIIRYRTDAIPIREMTYLFIVIGISIINALANKKISIAELLFTNLIIIVITFAYEKIWLLKHESKKLIIYEKIDLIVPEKYSELLEDLKNRTGIKTIKRIEIGRIDFLRDTCRLTIYYEEHGSTINLSDQADWTNFTNNNNDD